MSSSPERRDAARRWTALVLAGQRPGVDPLAARFGLAAKALIPVGGQPMLGRVVRTLLAVDAIGTIIVLAQHEDTLRDAPELAWLRDEPRVRFATSGASISASVRQVLESDTFDWPVLVTTADHALLTPEMVRTFITQAAGVDCAVGLVERRTLLARYPDNRRTWLHFRGGAYSGANLFGVGTPAVAPLLDHWADIEQQRKKGWRVAASFGPYLLLRALTRSISVQTALAQIGRRWGLSIAPVVLPQPEAAIDVDKPSDHELAETILAARGGV